MDQATYEQKCKEYFDEFLTPPVGEKTLRLPTPPYVFEIERHKQAQLDKLAQEYIDKRIFEQSCEAHWEKIRNEKAELRAKNFAEFGTYYPGIKKTIPDYEEVKRLTALLQLRNQEISLLKKELAELKMELKKKESNAMDRISEEMAASHDAVMAVYPDLGLRDSPILPDEDEVPVVGEKVCFQDEDDAE